MVHKHSELPRKGVTNSVCLWPLVERLSPTIDEYSYRSGFNNMIEFQMNTANLFDCTPKLITQFSGFSLMVL